MRARIVGCDSEHFALSTHDRHTHACCARATQTFKYLIRYFKMFSNIVRWICVLKKTWVSSIVNGKCFGSWKKKRIIFKGFGTTLENFKVSLKNFFSVVLFSVVATSDNWLEASCCKVLVFAYLQHNSVRRQHVRLLVDFLVVVVLQTLIFS